MLQEDNTRLRYTKKATIRLSQGSLFLLFMLCFCCMYNAAVYGQRKLALLVGISNYKAGSGWNVISSHNDINIISNMLQRQGFDSINIHVVEDEKATKDGIVNGLKQLAAEAKPGDIVYFHFSGHGQQLYDDNSDEEDGYDEALVTWDAPMRYNANDKEKHLRDDLLDTLFTAIRVKIVPGGQLVVSLDECHSGTGARAALQNNIVRRGTEIVYAPRNYQPNTKKSAVPEDFEPLNNKVELAPAIIMSACAPQEINYEYSKGACGSLTFALSQTFENLDTSTTYRFLFDKIKSVMARIARNQMPQIEGNVDYTVFGGNVNAAIPYYTIKRLESDTTVIINGGKLQNLSEGSKVGFYPPDTRDTIKVKPIAYGTIISADNLSAVIKAENARTINNLNWVIITEGFYPFKVAYNYSSDFPGNIRQKVDSAFNSLKALYIDKIASDVLLQYQHLNGAATCKLINAQGYTVDSLNMADEQFLSNLRLGILKTGQANYLRGLSASGLNDSIKVEAEFLPLECENSNGNIRIKRLLEKSAIMNEQQMGYFMKDGTYFQVKLTNKGAAKAYYTIIDIQPDDKVNFLVPRQGEQPSSYSLQPMEQKIFPATPYSIGKPYGNEVFEVIASSEPVELNLIQGKRRGANEHTNAFARLLDAIKDDTVLSRGLENNTIAAPVGVFIIHYKIIQ